MIKFLKNAHWPVSQKRIDESKEIDYRVGWDIYGGYPKTLERYSDFHANTIAFNLAIRPEDIEILNADEYQAGRILLSDMFIEVRNEHNPESIEVHLTSTLRKALFGFLKSFPSMKTVQDFIDHYELSEYAGQDEGILKLKRLIGEDDLGPNHYPIFKINMVEMREQLEHLIAIIVSLLVAECHDETCKGGGCADLTVLWIELDRMGLEWEVPRDTYDHIHACWSCWCQATGIEGKKQPRMVEIDLRSGKKQWKAPIRKR